MQPQPPSTTLDIEDPAQLRAYLIRTGRLKPDHPVTLRRLSGGVSARTVRVQLGGTEAWVLKQALPRLRVESDWNSDPARIHREAEGLRWLGRLIPGATPRFLFEDFENHLLAMEAVPEPHARWKEMLLAGVVEDAHFDEFARLLARLHSANVARNGLAEPFRDRTFFESLRIEPYYAYTGRAIPQAMPFLEALIEDVRARQIALVHGDYSPKNVLVFEGRLVLLDHEVMHLGDPAFDVGFALTHLLSKAHHLRRRRTTLGRAAHLWWSTYRRALGNAPWEGLEPRAVRHTLGCLLARAAGRSPLEYLTATERARQQETVISLMVRPPRSLPDLVDAFLTRLPLDAQNS